MRRRHDARVYIDRLGSPEPRDFALFQHAQELRLRRRRQIADLVEEERPTTSRLEGALTRGIGARECAPLVSEQLALDELMRQCRAVDRDKRPFGIGAEAVQLASDELFARAAFSDDQHGAGYRRDADDRLLELRERGTRAHERRLEPEPAPEQRDLLAQPTAVDRVLDFLRNPLHRLCFIDEAVRAQSDRLRATVVVARPGVDDDRHPQPESPDGSQDLKAVHSRHFEIEYDAVDRVARQTLERGAAALGYRRLVTAQTLQVVRVLLGHGGDVVDDEDLGHVLTP